MKQRRKEKCLRFRFYLIVNLILDTISVTSYLFWYWLKMPDSILRINDRRTQSSAHCFISWFCRRFKPTRITHVCVYKRNFIAKILRIAKLSVVVVFLLSNMTFSKKYDNFRSDLDMNFWDIELLFLILENILYLLRSSRYKLNFLKFKLKVSKSYTEI